MRFLLPSSWPGAPTALRALLLGLLLPAPPAAAADLVEPWEPGFSDLEIYLAGSSGTSAPSAASVFGFGLPADLSFGATLSSNREGSSRLGVVAFWTTSIGSSWEMDVYAEAGRQRHSGSSDSSDGLVGTEWSFDQYRIVPYLRLTRVFEEAHITQGLVGVVLPIGDRLDVHLEFSSELSGKGRLWTVGPNVRIGRGLELCTELSFLQESQGATTDPGVWIASVGLILDPRQLPRARSSG